MVLFVRMEQPGVRGFPLEQPVVVRPLRGQAVQEAALAEQEHKRAITPIQLELARQLISLTEALMIAQIGCFRPVTEPFNL